MSKSVATAVRKMYSFDAKMQSSHSKLSWKVYHILIINQPNSCGKSMVATSKSLIQFQTHWHSNWWWLKLGHMPPFQNEGPEKGGSVRKLVNHSASKPFGWEGEEKERKHVGQKKRKAKRPFQSEESESEDASVTSEGSDNQDPVFSLGWQNLHSFVQSTAWSRHVKAQEEEEKQRKKRAYNNKKRAAAALASGNPTVRKNVYETSGKDESRILSLVQRDCQCASSNIVCLLLAVVFKVSHPSSNFITLRCFQDLFHAVRIQEQGPFEILGRVL